MELVPMAGRWGGWSDLIFCPNGEVMGRFLRVGIYGSHFHEESRNVKLISFDSIFVTFKLTIVLQFFNRSIILNLLTILNAPILKGYVKSDNSINDIVQNSRKLKLTIALMHCYYILSIWNNVQYFVFVPWDHYLPTF